jgi:hypothetical protein
MDGAPWRVVMMQTIRAARDFRRRGRPGALGLAMSGRSSSPLPILSASSRGSCGEPLRSERASPSRNQSPRRACSGGPSGGSLTPVVRVRRPQRAVPPLQRPLDCRRTRRWAAFPMRRAPPRARLTCEPLSPFSRPRSSSTERGGADTRWRRRRPGFRCSTSGGRYVANPDRTTRNVKAPVSAHTTISRTHPATLRTLFEVSE